MVGRKEEACFDSQTTLGQLQTRSDAANAKVPILHHNLSADCSMEGRTAFVDDQGMKDSQLEHETKEGTTEGDSKMAQRVNGHTVMKSFARKGVEAVVDP